MKVQVIHPPPAWGTEGHRAPARPEVAFGSLVPSGATVAPLVVTHHGAWR